MAICSRSPGYPAVEDTSVARYRAAVPDASRDARWAPGGPPVSRLGELPYVVGVTCREEVLAAFEALHSATGEVDFSAVDVLAQMRRAGTSYKDATVRTCQWPRECPRWWP